MLFEPCEDVISSFPDAIVHPVNCTGLGHDAFSNQLKKTWPHYFKEYSRNCIRKHLVPAEPKIVELGMLLGTRYVITLPVKGHWREQLNPELLRTAFSALVTLIEKESISSIAIPAFSSAPSGWTEKEISRLFELNNIRNLETVYLFNTDM